MKILKALITVIISVIVLLIIFIKFSTVTTTYLCTDKLTANTSDKLLQLTIKKHHPWTNLWNISIGKLKYSISLKESGTFSHIIQKENLLQIYKHNGASMIFIYSELTDRLHLDTVDGSFKGECKVLIEYCSNNILH